MADDLVRRAVETQCAGCLDEAAEQYRAALTQVPDHAAAHHFLGILLYQQGKTDDALSHIERSIAAQPGRADWHNDYGNLLAALGHREAAVSAFFTAVELDPQLAIAWNNLGAMLMQQTLVAEAEQCFANAVYLDSGFEDALNNLGQAQTQLGRPLDAARSFCSAFVARPSPEKSPQALGTAYYVLGRIEEAAQIYSSWLQDDPGHPVATHMLAACTGKDVPERASDAYLETVFDQAAGQFDSKMTGTLSYHIPQLIGEVVDDIAGPTGAMSILDAGCGTGLCGQYLARHARHLLGVDLSGKSLALAEEKKRYQQLVKQEIVEFLTHTDTSFDLAVSADTYNYFGSLRPLLRALSSRLLPGGWLIATTESRDEVKTGYAITPSGRYCHSRDYLQTCYREAGFDMVEIRPVQIRVELEAPVSGVLLVARKRAAP